jgi:hypothetical protein
LRRAATVRRAGIITQGDPMKKIALNLEKLSVVSFDLGDGEQDRGTVQGNQEHTLNIHCYSRVGSCNRTACCPETTIC